MSWLTDLFGISTHTPPAPPPTTAARAPLLSPRAVAGGRVTLDTEGSSWLGNNWIVSPPDNYEDEWRLGNFDANTLSKVSPDKLIEMLSDLSPEISRGLWDFQRMVNPGYEIKATRPGGKTEYPRAQKAIDAVIKTLNDRHGSFDVVIGRLSMSAFWRGALLPELVLDETGRMPLDLAVTDPVLVRFKKLQDPVLGPVYQLGQWQDGEWVSLDLPTIRYVPVDPAIGSPYGRPMVSPALFTALFLLVILHDLRRVVQQQGYPRLDISIDLEKMVEGFDEVANDPKKYQEWADGVISMVIAAYAQLEPDDAYVHSSVVTVNKPVGAVDSSSLGAVDALIKANERMATRALKTMPLMMGLDQSTNETDSNRQWEIFVAGIKSIQHYIETVLSRLFTLALEVQGIQAEVRLELAELRAAEELRDEQTRTMRNNSTAFEYDRGWISQDEAAQKAVGHAPDQPAPRNTQTAQNEPVQGDGDGDEALNQGSDRGYIVQILKRMESWIERQERAEEDAAIRIERAMPDALGRASDTNGRVNGNHEERNGIHDTTYAI